MAHTLALTRTGDEAGPVQDLVAELWFLLEKCIAQNVTQGAEKRICSTCYDDAIADLAAWSTAQELAIELGDGGGLNPLSALAAAHWAYMALLSLGEQVNTLAHSHGYAITDLASLDEYVAHPDVVLFTYRGILYAVCENEAGEYYTVFDDQPQALEFHDLPPAQQDKVAEWARRRTCQCSFCARVRNGQVKPLDVAALLRQKPAAPHFKSLRQALAWKAYAVKLTLYEQQLAELPETVGQLSLLEELGLSENRLRALPQSLGRLHKLRVLRLDKNQFDDAPDVVCTLPALERLNLADNPLQTLNPGLAHLRSLRRLELSFSNRYPAFEPFPEVLTHLPALEYLSIFSAPAWAEALAHLDWKACMPNLRELLLWHCDLPTFPVHLRGIASLEHLSLIGGQSLVVPEWIGEFPNLRTLKLDGCGLETLPAAVADMTQLTWLNVAHNALRALPNLSRLTNLTHLYLNDNQFQTLPPFPHLPQLTYLDLSRNPLCAAPDLSRLTNLGTLHLQATW